MKKRIQPLDGLRAIAAFGVVWIHVWTFYGNPSLVLFTTDVYKLVAILGNGVDFFFVISGFCMYLMIDKQYTVKRYLAFLKKRFLRIAPAFYVSVLVYAGIVQFNHPSFPFWYNVFFHFLFLNNVVTGNSISAPFWSIGTEWHFYLLLPFLVYLSRNFSLVKTVVFFSFTSLSFFFIINTGHLSYDWWEPQILVRFPEFGAGILCAYCYLKAIKIPSPFRGISGLLSGFLVMYLGRLLKVQFVLYHAGSLAPFLKTIADTIMCTGFAFILYHVITQPSVVASLLGANQITYLGRISYSIYLWHSLVIYLISPFLLKLTFGVLNPIAGFLCTGIITVVIAHFSYQLFEAFYFKRK